MVFEEIKNEIITNVKSKLDYISFDDTEVKEQLYSLLEERSLTIFEYERPSIEHNMEYAQIKESVQRISTNLVKDVCIKYLVSILTKEKVPHLTIAQRVEGIIFNYDYYRFLYQKNTTYTTIIDTLRSEYRVLYNRMKVFVGKNPQKKIYIILFYFFIPIFWVPGIIKFCKHINKKRDTKKMLESKEFEIKLRLILYSEKYTKLSIDEQKKLEVI